MHLIRRVFSDNLLHICWETVREIKSWKQSSKLTSSREILIQRLCCPQGIHRVPHPLEYSKSFKVQPWEQEGNKKGASMLINSNAYYKGQLQWCAKRHQKGYTDVSQPRMQESAFNVESQRIYSCCCIAIFNEWSRKDRSVRQILFGGTEIPDFWKIGRTVHFLFIFYFFLRLSCITPGVMERQNIRVQRKINCINKVLTNLGISKNGSPLLELCYKEWSVCQASVGQLW